jgi:hypothetical protein
LNGFQPGVASIFGQANYTPPSYFLPQSGSPVAVGVSSSSPKSDPGDTHPAFQYLANQNNDLPKSYSATSARNDERVRVGPDSGVPGTAMSKSIKGGNASEVMSRLMRFLKEGVLSPMKRGWVHLMALFG